MPLATPKKDAHGNVTQVSSLQYIYNSEYVKDKIINFTYIQNLGEADLVNFKEGNLFAYAWSATIYMNYVSEFAWSRVYPVEKLVIDLYDPKGFPISSLDQFGHAVTKTHTATTGETVEVPAEPTVALTAAKPHDYAPFAITAPYAGAVEEITPEARVLIESAVVGIGGEVSIHKTPYMAVANMPLSLNHVEGAEHDADMLATAKAVFDAIKQATGEEYVRPRCRWAANGGQAKIHLLCRRQPARNQVLSQGNNCRRDNRSCPSPAHVFTRQGDGCPRYRRLSFSFRHQGIIVALLGLLPGAKEIVR